MDFRENKAFLVQQVDPVVLVSEVNLDPLAHRVLMASKVIVV